MSYKLSNPQYPSNKLGLNQNSSDFLITKCDGNTNIGGDNSGIDYFFNQESPYKFPQLIICDDSKRINVNKDVYHKYSDVIIDECGNRFNIKNLNSSVGILQEGYSKNIDLDSHLKNINFYSDKCFYDNWKMNPKIINEPCNGLKRNEKVLVKDYTSVGRRYEDCIGNGPCADNTETCYNTPPTDLNCETDVKKRYNLTHNKFNKESCVKPVERVSFKTTPISKINNLDKYPNTKRTSELLNTINSGITHEYYKFFEDTKCMHFPAERLFNNNTSRKATPNHHNMYNIDPVYLK